jgi:hypothetical protein
MNASTLNIYERIVREKSNDPHGQFVPRIFVKRHAIARERFAEWVKHVHDLPNDTYARFFSHDFPTPDITRNFRLVAGDAVATRDDCVELDIAHYSERPCNPKMSIKFSFTVPVAADDCQIFYGEADRGFLWAHGFLCRFKGDFSEPSDVTVENLWRS